MTEYIRPFVRDLIVRCQEPSLPFLQVLIGPRQVGKSTGIAQVADTWTGPKIIESADQVSPPTTDWIKFHWQRALEMPGTCLLALDEIQKISNWHDQVKVLFDRDRHKKKLKVILSGSASLTLQQGLTESLAGRYELIRCPHWGLDECQEYFHWDLIQYLKFGGYPAPAIYVAQPQRWQALIRDGIVEPVLGRDLQGAVAIQKPALLRQLFALAMHYPAQEISFRKLLGQLQDHGTTATIRHYLDILGGGFLVATLQKYSSQAVRQKASSPKILPLAPALINAFTLPDQIDSNSEWRGRVFEAAIGAHLYRLGHPLYYWREGDWEVDYVLDTGSQIIAIEVKSGRRKSDHALIEFKKRFPAALTKLVTWESGAELLAGSRSLDGL